MVTLRCAVLRANPPRLSDIRWFRNGGLIRTPLPMPTTELKEPPELRFKLEPANNGTYECRVSSSVGTSTCTFNVSGRSARRLLPVWRQNLLPLNSLVSFLSPAAQPYNAEFYYDTPNPVRIQKGNNYSYNLQWTQKDPEATDRVIGYWLNVRKVSLVEQPSSAPPPPGG